MRAPTASRVDGGQLGAWLHRADGRGLPPAPANAGRPAAPGDPGAEWKPTDQSHSEGADRCSEGQKVYFDRAVTERDDTNLNSHVFYPRIQAVSLV